MQHFNSSGEGHHKTKASITQNMFVYGATALVALGVIGVLAIALIGIYKVLEWMLAL